jgi:hypothetical protein
MSNQKNNHSVDIKEPLYSTKEKSIALARHRSFYKKGNAVIIKWGKAEIGDYFVIPLTGSDSSIRHTKTPVYVGLFSVV